MAALLVYILTGHGDWIFQTSYLQSTEQIYIMEAGILYNEQAFRDGEDYVKKYDFEKALALMNAYASRLHHSSSGMQNGINGSCLILQTIFIG